MVARDGQLIRLLVARDDQLLTNFDATLGRSPGAEGALALKLVGFERRAFLTDPQYRSSLAMMMYLLDFHPHWLKEGEALSKPET